MLMSLNSNMNYLSPSGEGVVVESLGPHLLLLESDDLTATGVVLYNITSPAVTVGSDDSCHVVLKVRVDTVTAAHDLIALV